MDSGPIVLKSKDRPRKLSKLGLITQAQAEKAAEQCGMVVARVSGLKNHAAIGKYIEQLGATQISRSAIMARKHQIEADVQKIQGFIDQQDGGDLCLIMDLYKLKAAFDELALRHDQAQMKLKGDTVTVQAQAPIMMAFPPGITPPILPESSCVDLPNTENKES